MNKVKYIQDVKKRTHHINSLTARTPYKINIFLYSCTFNIVSSSNAIREILLHLRTKNKCAI